MGKTIGLNQLANKKYNLVQGIPPSWLNSIGYIEDTFDAILYGPSGSGKTNCTVELLKCLLTTMPKATAEYVSYEEGHGYTVQTLMIHRHNMLELVGNRMKVSESLAYEDLIKRINKRQSAKIWIFDSIQASGISWLQYKHIKETFVGGKKRKILLSIAWGEGLKPDGAVAKKIEYYANVKMRVEGKVMFPKSRFGGNKPFVIWQGNETEGAMQYWGKNYYKITGTIKPKKAQKNKPNENTTTSDSNNSPEPVASQPNSQINSETHKQITDATH